VIDVKLAAEMWHTHVPILPIASDSPPDGSRDASWASYCNRLAAANQPLFCADSGSLPSDWQTVGLESLMNRPVGSGRQKKMRQAGA